jgi:DNA-binding IclR family transcriptional regulator|tara:strand:- start:13704 stop:14525 length:822 start_codon:yes stop_codon:yes gene_type:complete
MNNITKDKTPGTKRVQVVIRTVDILRAIGNTNEDLTLSDLAARTSLPRSTVHRIVQTLESVHFVAKGASAGGLRLGPEFDRLAANSRHALIPTMRPFLENLARESAEGASLTVLEGLNVRFLDQAIVGHGLRAITLVGTTLPAHCTANGKILLAALPQAVLRRMLPKQLERRTDQTITDPELLIDELDRISTEGVAFDREECGNGISAISALVVDDSRNYAAISVAMPTARFDSHEEFLTEIVRRTAHEASLALGWRDSNGNSPGPKLNTVTN